MTRNAYNYLTVEMLKPGDRIWRMATITSHSPIYVMRNGLEIGRMRSPQLSRIPGPALVRNPSAGRSLNEDYIFIPARTYPAPIGPMEETETDVCFADPTAIGLGEVYIRTYKGSQFPEVWNWSLSETCRLETCKPGTVHPFRCLYHWKGGPWRDASGFAVPFPANLRPRYV